MKVFSLQRREFIARPLPEVFNFFQRPENLEMITPPSLKFKVVTPSPIVMRQGLEISYLVYPLLFPMKWTSVITEYKPPYLFVDQQKAGPYALWNHTHRFAEENGGTWVEDEVRYALPFGLIGLLMHALVVRRQLNGIFDFRTKMLSKIFNPGAC